MEVKRMGLEVRPGFESLLDRSLYYLGETAFLFSVESVRMKSVHMLLFLLAWLCFPSLVHSFHSDFQSSSGYIWTNKLHILFSSWEICLSTDRYDSTVFHSHCCKCHLLVLFEGNILIENQTFSKGFRSCDVLCIRLAVSLLTSCVFPSWGAQSCWICWLIP